jgi:MoaA/NifB/PqqE/SkfB family radical SAM enzyme
MSETFCVLPWMHLATTASGQLRVCCNSTPGKNLILRNDGTAYRVNDKDIEAAWESKTLHNLRQQLLDGTRAEMCTRCWREEDAGIKSARQGWNQAWTVENTAVDSPMQVKYVDLRLGNLCNLKCRMCNPYASNQWVDEWGLIDNALSASEHARLSNMDWPNDPQVWNNLALFSSTIEEIYLTGGEPTLAKAQYDLFDRLIELDVAKNITLKYNTNLTNIPQRMIDYWEHFKRIKINASIDAFGDLNHYIRYPANWKSIDKNLRIFLEMRSRNKCTLSVHCTVQIYNILQLSELIDYVDSIGDIPIYFNILNHPDCLNIRVLPFALKQLASDRLQSYRHKPKVDGIISYMMGEDWDNKWDDFVKYTKTLDISRGENISTLVREFNELY